MLKSGVRIPHMTKFHIFLSYTEIMVFRCLIVFSFLDNPQILLKLRENQKGQNREHAEQRTSKTANSYLYKRVHFHGFK
jgi:hypothetical protein